MQRQRVNGISGRIGVGKLTCHRGQRRNGRAHSIDFAPAQRVRLVHALHHDGAGVAVERKTVFAARPNPVTAVVPLATGGDAQPPAFVEVILQSQRFQRTVGNGRVMGDVLIWSLNKSGAIIYLKLLYKKLFFEMYTPSVTPKKAGW